WVRALKWAAGYLIRFSMRQAGILLLGTWGLVGVCGWMLTRIGTDFLPPFDEGSVQINVGLPSGSSLQASNEAAAVIDARLRRSRDIAHFVRRTGRAELDEHVEPVSRSEYILNMNPHSGRSRDDVLRELLQDLKAD